VSSSGAFGLLTFLIVAVVGGMAPIFGSAKLRRVFVDTIYETCRSTMSITSMIFIILLGATAFALVFTRLGGDSLVQGFLAAMPGGQTGAVMVVMAIMFVLGFFLDTFEIIFITVPITAPIILMMGVDPILLGVLIGLVLQTSFLTPPFGFSLFYLRGVAPPSITTTIIYRGIIPFVFIQLVVLMLVWQWQALATYLPNLLFRTQSAAQQNAPPPPSFFDQNQPESDGG
jgi:TRAP-type mannitol/chloroaromatic compound transport system permease large subunit